MPESAMQAHREKSAGVLISLLTYMLQFQLAKQEVLTCAIMAPRLCLYQRPIPYGRDHVWYADLVKGLWFRRSQTLGMKLPFLFCKVIMSICLLFFLFNCHRQLLSSSLIKEIYISVNDSQCSDSWLVKMLRTSDYWLLIPQWDTNTLPWRLQKHYRKGDEKNARSKW